MLVAARKQMKNVPSNRRVCQESVAHPRLCCLCRGSRPGPGGAAARASPDRHALEEGLVALLSTHHQHPHSLSHGRGSLPASRPQSLIAACRETEVFLQVLQSMEGQM
jgi:hypothetical protein